MGAWPCMVPNHEARMNRHRLDNIIMGKNTVDSMWWAMTNWQDDTCENKIVEKSIKTKHWRIWHLIGHYNYMIIILEHKIMKHM